jgi:hypothetical protein
MRDSSPGAVFNETLTQAREQLVQYCTTFSSLGIQSLEALMKLASPVRLDDEVLLTLVAFADQTRDWTTPEAKAAATRLLEQQFRDAMPTKEHFITEVVLQSYLRPLFSRAKPASITASGRKAEYADSSAARGENIPDDSALTKPWKYTDLRAIPAVAWAVHEADVSSFPVCFINFTR